LKCVIKSIFINFSIYSTGFLNLSKNDLIQQKTADLKKIPLLIDMCDQYLIVYDIIWAFSFNQDIQQQLRSSSAFITKLAHLNKKSDNKQMRKIIHGIIWNLDTNHQVRRTTEITDGKIFDFMISYSHQEKTLCKQLYQELAKAGYRVCIDLHQIHENVMDAMVQAIDRSHTIIICMSEHYRKSNFCRAEAHYAFQRQRKIVPVLLQQHYKPDGWLLFLIGQLLYVNFTKYEFALAMNMLLKEVKSTNITKTNVAVVRPKENSEFIPTIQSTALNDASTQSNLPENILDWTQTHVHDWCIGHNLSQMSRLLTDCDGRTLVYLCRHLKRDESQQCMRSLQEDSIRRIGETLSLIELSCLQSLIDQEKRTTRLKLFPRPTKNCDKSDS